MPIRWSTNSTKASSPLLRAVLSSMAKSSHQSPRATLPRSAKSILERQSQSQRSFQSTPPHNKNILSNLSSIASISKSIAVAGTGTFMSTLFALYLATEVESYAHSTLYEYFPHKYYPIADEDLPRVIKDKEMIRRRTGLVTSERANGRVWDDSYLSVDGMVVIDDTNVGGEELMAEQQLESELTGSSNMNLWQRQMTKKREQIIEREEREFTSGEVKNARPLWEEFKSSSYSNDSQLSERKKLQEEMTKRFQERLMSTAMTA